MKAFKLCENAQLKNLSTTELNNNGPSNGKSANSYVKNAMSENLQNGDVLSDKSKVFKQRMSSSTTSSVATDANTDGRCTSKAAAAAAAAASSKKSCNIENFLSSSVPNAAAAAVANVETARNGFLAAAAAAAQQYTPFNLFTPYLKDMFLAAQLLRGKPKKKTSSLNFTSENNRNPTPMPRISHTPNQIARQM